MSILIAIFFVLGMVGMTHIVVDSKITRPLREWVEQKHIPFFFGHELHEMINCHQCSGFWIGLVMWPCMLPFLPIHWGIWQLVTIPAIALLFGCCISLLSVMARALIDWLTLNVTIPQEILNEQEETEQT